jgi:diphthine synthase
MLYLVGLGLGSEQDVTLRGLRAVRACSLVVLERYTSVLGVDKSALEELYGKRVDYADRDCVETGAEEAFLGRAAEEDVAFLVVGDPLCATTHTDLMLRAMQKGIKVEVIHNTSIMGAAASCGLQLYNFGAAVSLCLWDRALGWTPSSYYEKVHYNLKGGLHTLCLLDIKVHEPDFAKMAQGKGVHYLAPRYMTVWQAARQLLEVERERGGGAYGPETRAVGLARLGQPSQKIVAGTLEQLCNVDMGAPLHSLVLVGETHPLEEEILEMYAVKAEDIVQGLGEEVEPEDSDDDHVSR